MAIFSETTTLDAQILDRVNAFVVRWEKAKGTERANYQIFFIDLCDALGVARPDPQQEKVIVDIFTNPQVRNPEKTAAMI